ncbi:hypothetical protein EYC84_006264 [Monilinia fructicola]|uniref:Acetate permease A n=1 Tax=Monilinia fructicola TaxID=38448 RepID=A0A5M9K7P4_MONFR|nr:hypothetical protein EYC84_006264 [Monilinia fructicola]
MATTATADTAYNKEYNSENSGSGTNTHDHAPVNGAGANNAAASRGYDYGGNPLAHMNTGESARFPAFGGEFQPGLYKPTTERKFANPAPLGLSAFALTTFVLSLVNVGTAGVTQPNIVVALAFGYGGLVQLLAGMWEMAVGNTFGATALSSYGGFWLSSPSCSPLGVLRLYNHTKPPDQASTISTMHLDSSSWDVAFFLLFFTLDLAFLMLGIGHLQADSAGAPQSGSIKAGGYFGLFAAFIAWYNALAGLADDSNSFFVIPVAHFPWSVKGRERRNKTERETV